MPPPNVDVEAPHTDLTNDHPRNGGSSGSSFKNDPASGEKLVAADEAPSGGRRASTLGALLNNPLVGMTREDVLADVDRFVEQKGIAEHRDVFRKGALVAQVSNQDGAFEHIDELDADEKAILRREITNRWSQPFMLYFLCTLCAGSAIVQGMDQSAVNGAQVSLVYSHSVLHSPSPS